MVFQPFLDQSLQQPVRGRGYVVSFALHGLVALLIWSAWGQVASGDAPVPALVQATVSLRPPYPQPGSRFVGPAPGPAAERPKRGSWPAASRPTEARPAVVVALEPAAAPPASVQPTAEDEPDAEPGALDGEAAPGGTGAGGPGVGEGPSGEIGEDRSRPGRRRPIELFGRVVGGNRREMVGAQGVPYASLKESTALRSYDFFPPLPAAQWAGDRPYLVVLDVCVSGEGQVSEVALVRPASRVFDPVVLEAVRTWRYKPRLVDGQAQAFCHVVAIKYEQL
jgi:TonB family protein